MPQIYCDGRTFSGRNVVVHGLPRQPYQWSVREIPKDVNFIPANGNVNNRADVAMAADDGVLRIIK